MNVRLLLPPAALLITLGALLSACAGQAVPACDEAEFDGALGDVSPPTPADRAAVRLSTQEAETVAAQGLSGPDPAPTATCLTVLPPGGRHTQGQGPTVAYVVGYDVLDQDLYMLVLVDAVSGEGRGIVGMVR